MKQSCSTGAKNKKQNRRNEKNSASRIVVLNTEENVQEADSIKKHEPEIITPDEKKPELFPKEPVPEISVPPVSTPKEVFSGGVQTDISLENNKPQKNSESSGIVYELAEELYRREKTLEQLEALCNPPFEKQFTPSQKIILDEQAEMRLDTLAKAAAKKQRKLTFLPEGIFSDEDKPISTLQAFLLQLIMFIRALNIVTAGVLLMMPHTNSSIRSFSRATLIWSGIMLGVLFLYFLVYYLRANNGFFRI